MEYLKKAATGALLVLASPLVFGAVAVDDRYVIDVQQRERLFFFPNVNDVFDEGFTGFSQGDFQLIQGEGSIEVLSGGDGPVFTPAQGFVGPVEIRYTIEDSAGADQATVFVDVRNNGADFEAVDDTFYIPESIEIATPFPVRLNDVFDFRSDFPAFVESTSGTSAQGGTVSVNSETSVEYTPPANFTGKDTFTYSLEGGPNAQASEATVTVFVGVEPGQEDTDSGDSDDSGDSQSDSISKPDNLNDEEARTFDVIIAACEQDDDNSLPCDAIADQTPEEKKRLAQQLSGRHTKLQARTMRQLQRQQSRNVNSRLSEIRSERNQVSVDGLNLAIMGKSLPIGRALQGSLRGGSAGDGELISPWGAFINGKISMGESNQTDTRPSYDQDGYDLTFGLDYRFSDATVLGAAVGLGESDTDFTSSQGEQDARSFSLLSFGNFYPADNLYIDGFLMWTQGDLDVERRINVANIEQQLASDTDSRQLTAASSVGYEINHKSWQSALYGRLEYSSLTIDDYTETGGSLGLQVDEQDTESFTSTLGTRLGYAFSWSRGVVVPSVDLEYIKEGSDDFNIRNQFADALPAGQFRINAEEPDTEYMSASAGASAVFGGGRSAFVRYETLLLQDNYDFSSYSVGFRTEF